MTKSRFAALLTGLLVTLPQIAAATTEFTSEQRAEIARMIADALTQQRTQVRSEVEAELKARAHEAAPGQQTAVASKGQPPKQDTSADRDFVPQGLNSVIDRDVSSAPSNFQLSGGTDASTASIRLVSEKSSMDGANGIFSTKSLTISAPLDKGSQGYTNVATLDGLASGFRIAYNYSKFITSELRNPAKDDGSYEPEYLSLCADAGIDTKKTPEKCTRGAIQKGLENQGLTDKVKQLDEQFEAPLPWRRMYGFKLSAGRDSYDFFVPDLLTKNTAIREPWSASTYLGFVPPGRDALLTGSLEFQHSYMAAKSRVECPATSGTKAFECVNGSIGAPQEKDKHLVALEYRSKFLEDKAYSIKLTHDVHNGDTGLDLPIYLISDGSGGLNGGLRVGWTNTDKFAFGVFVGSTFGIYQ